MSTFDDNFPAKGSPKMSDRVFGFDSEGQKNAGITNQALYDLFKSELDPTLPKPADFLPAFDLENARVMTSTAPDGKIVKSNVLGRDGEVVTFKEVSEIPDTIDGEVFVELNGDIFQRVFDPEQTRTLVVDSLKDVGTLSTRHKVMFLAGIYTSLQTLGFYEKGDGGGGVFTWDKLNNKSNHNGGTIIDPDRVTAWDGTKNDLNTYFSASGSGVGCFVRVLESNELSVEIFGIKKGKTPSSAFVAAQKASDYHDLFLLYPEPDEYESDNDIVILANNVKLKSPHDKKTTLKNVRFNVSNNLFNYGVGHSGTSNNITYALLQTENAGRLIVFNKCLVMNIDRYFMRDMRSGAGSFYYDLLDVHDCDFIDNNLVANTDLSVTTGMLFRLTTPCSKIKFNSNRVINLGNNHSATSSRALSYTPDVQPPMGELIAKDNHFENIFGGGSSNMEVHAIMSFARTSYFENNELREIHSNTENDGEDKEGIYTKSTYTYFINNRCYNASSRPGSTSIDSAALISKGGQYNLYTFASGNEVYGGNNGIESHSAYTVFNDNICMGMINPLVVTPNIPREDFIDPILNQEIINKKAPKVESNNNTCVAHDELGESGILINSFGTFIDINIRGGRYATPITSLSASTKRAIYIVGIDHNIDIRDCELVTRNSFFSGSGLTGNVSKSIVFENIDLTSSSTFDLPCVEYTRFHCKKMTIVDGSIYSGEASLIRMHNTIESTENSKTIIHIENGSYPGGQARLIRSDFIGELEVSGKIKTRGNTTTSLLSLFTDNAKTVKFHNLDVLGVRRLLNFYNPTKIDLVRIENNDVKTETNLGVSDIFSVMASAVSGVEINTLLFTGNALKASDFTNSYSGTITGRVVGLNTNDAMLNS